MIDTGGVVTPSEGHVRGGARTPRPGRSAVAFAGLAGVLLAATVASLGLGATRIAPADAVGALVGRTGPDPVARTILVELRLPRALLAGLIGVGLGTAGAAYQALFRNPLADPFVVGASSGAAFGAAVVIVTGWAGPAAAIGPASTGAFLGALAAVGLVYLIGTAGDVPSANLILAGAAVSTMLGGLVWLVMALADQDLPRIVGWLMGGLSGRGWPVLAGAWPLILAGSGLLWALARPLDAICCGEEEARALGLPVGAVLSLTLAGASLAAATAVAAGGVIGFVGLAAPHLARPLVGAAHARLLPASGLIGAALLLSADTLARSAAPPLELPVGVVTAMLGGPFFLTVLRRRATASSRGA